MPADAPAILRAGASAAMDLIAKAGIFRLHHQEILVVCESKRKWPSSYIGVHIKSSICDVTMELSITTQ